MVKLGIIRNIANIRMLMKVRDIMRPIPKKQKPPWNDLHGIDRSICRA